MFALALAAALGLTPLAGRLATALGIVDHPAGRKAHARPTPLLGGAPIFAVLFAALGGGLVLLHAAGESPPFAAAVSGYAAERARALSNQGTILGFLAGLGVMFATGLIDDLRKDRFPWPAKLLGQTAAAAIAVAAGARADVLGFAPLNAAASVLWIVTIANAMNFLDHADGLAAGVALVAAAVFGAVALLQEQYLMALALAALGGALAGFLAHNLPPARIFLGDAGALTIGYALGALTLLESYVTRHGPGYLPVLLPPIVLALPLFDMAVVLAIRLRAGTPLTRGDRNHLHHRLTRLGMSPRAALLTAYTATLALGAGAAALPESSWIGAVMIVVQTVATMALIAVLMFFGERRNGPEPPAGPTS